MAILDYGINSGGYWAYEKMGFDIVAVMDVMQVIYPGFQLMIELDHSSCHAKMRGGLGALQLAKLGLECGGEQRTLREMVVPEVGEHCAKMCVDDVEIDCKKKVGDKQLGYFLPTDPPPFVPLPVGRVGIGGVVRARMAGGDLSGVYRHRHKARSSAAAPTLLQTDVPR